MLKGSNTDQLSTVSEGFLDQYNKTVAEFHCESLRAAILLTLVWRNKDVLGVCISSPPSVVRTPSGGCRNSVFTLAMW